MIRFWVSLHGYGCCATETSAAIDETFQSVPSPPPLPPPPSPGLIPPLPTPPPPPHSIPTPFLRVTDTSVNLLSVLRVEGEGEKEEKKNRLSSKLTRLGCLLPQNGETQYGFCREFISHLFGRQVHPVQERLVLSLIHI